MRRPLRRPFRSRQARAMLVVAEATALLVSAWFGLTAPGRAGATSNPLAGSQGTDISLPATDSAVTVTGRGAYSGLTITVRLAPTT